MGGEGAHPNSTLTTTIITLETIDSQSECQPAYYYRAAHLHCCIFLTSMPTSSPPYPITATGSAAVTIIDAVSADTNDSLAVMA